MSGQVVIASADGLFTAFALTSERSGDFVPTAEAPVGTYRGPDNSIVQDMLGDVRQTFRFTWPQMLMTEALNLLNAVKIGGPWNIILPTAWDNVNPNATPQQYWICVLPPNALQIPFANRPPFKGGTTPVIQVTLTLQEIGRGP